MFTQQLDRYNQFPIDGMDPALQAVSWGHADTDIMQQMKPLFEQKSTDPEYKVYRAKPIRGSQWKLPGYSKPGDLIFHFRKTPDGAHRLYKAAVALPDREPGTISNIIGDEIEKERLHKGTLIFDWRS